MNQKKSAAREPEELPQLFLEFANAGDADGLASLYEENAVLAAGDVVATGRNAIREFYANLLQRRSQFPAPRLLAPLRAGELALTSAVSGESAVSAEIARQQPDGSWLWVVDQLKISVGSR